MLVVEDERRLASAVRRGLTAEGFVVDVAHDGVDGLHLAREGGYDAVVLDLMLPGLSGYQVCERLRAEREILYLSRQLVQLKTDPQFATLRSDPRISDLVRRVGPRPHAQRAALLRRGGERGRLALAKIMYVGGKVKALAVATEKRSPALPDWRTSW